MTELPPPVGSPGTLFPPPAGAPVETIPGPVADPDPWIEQERRDVAHRADRRRRRRRWLVPTLIVVVGAALVGAAAAVVAVVTADDPTTSTPGADPGVAAPTTSIATVPPGDLVAVDDVWLIDREDGVFEWGVTVRSARPDTRRDARVTIRLVDRSGAVIESVEGTFGAIDDDSPSAVAGRLVDPDRDPARIEYDLSVGVESDGIALGDGYDVLALERTGDELTGRIRSLVPTGNAASSILFVWHDDDGQVAASVPLVVDALRPAVDARFDVDLAEERVPDGPPDAIVWTL